MISKVKDSESFVYTFFVNLATDPYAEFICKLVFRYNKCLGIVRGGGGLCGKVGNLFTNLKAL